MEYEWSQLEWWLKDPDGYNASHTVWDTSKVASQYDANYIDPEPREEHPGLRMRHNMNIGVAHSTNMFETRIYLQYMNPKGKIYRQCNIPECTPEYITETYDDKEQSRFSDCSDKNQCPKGMLVNNTEFSCEQVAGKFVKKGGGFERRFRCWWAHDFVAPYWLEPDP